MHPTGVIRKCYQADAFYPVIELEPYPLGQPYPDGALWDFVYWSGTPGHVVRLYNDYSAAYNNIVILPPVPDGARYVEVYDPNGRRRGLYEFPAPDEILPGETIWYEYIDDDRDVFAWLNSINNYWLAQGAGNACMALHNYIYEKEGEDFTYVTDPPRCLDREAYCQLTISLGAFSTPGEMTEDGVFTLTLQTDLDAAPSEVHLFTKDQVNMGILELDLDACYTQDMIVQINKGQDLRSGAYLMTRCRVPE